MNKRSLAYSCKCPSYRPVLKLDNGFKYSTLPSIQTRQLFGKSKNETKEHTKSIAQSRHDYLMGWPKWLALFFSSFYCFYYLYRRFAIFRAGFMENDWPVTETGKKLCMSQFFSLKRNNFDKFVADDYLVNWWNDAVDIRYPLVGSLGKVKKEKKLELPEIPEPEPGYVSLYPQYCFIIDPKIFPHKVKSKRQKHTILKVKDKSKEKTKKPTDRIDPFIIKFFNELIPDLSVGKITTDIELVLADQDESEAVNVYRDTMIYIANNKNGAVNILLKPKDKETKLDKITRQSVGRWDQLNKDFKINQKEYKTGKNLKYLNRNLSKVLYITTNEDDTGLHPDNFLVLKPHQTELDILRLKDFLLILAETQVEDVRDEVRLRSEFGKFWLTAENIEKAEIRRKDLEINSFEKDL